MKQNPKNRKKHNPANTGILVSTYIFLAVFLGLIGYMIYFQVVKADDVINSSYNKRQSILAEKIERGSIISADGNIIATTVEDENGKNVRYYPYNNLFAHVTGYINNGGYGLEASAGYYMLTSNQNLFEQIANDLSGEKNHGDNLITTLDSGLQQAAYDALGSDRGAVIITEPSTGKILAMVSKPDFNPNTIAADWSSVTADGSDSVLINRATQGLYPPGSTFKIVTLLEYLRENPDNYKDYSYECKGSIDVSGKSISCSHGTVHGVQDTKMSFANSCNTSFINMGLTLNIDSYAQTAKDLLFNSELPVPMEYNKSQFVLKDTSSDWDIAQTAFGQGETLITPMHLALITSAVANDGMLMTPYVMQKVESVNGLTVKTFKGEEYGKLLTADEAAILQEDMGAVVTTSFNWLFKDISYTVAGKSGTAQYGTQGYEHSFFTSFSPAEDAKISVTVLIEGGPQKTQSGAEAAKKIYDYYYSR